MSTKNPFELSQAERRQRSFSEEFRQKKVRDIERGITTVTEVCRAYQVSRSSVYRWIDTFAVMKEKKERLIVESKSEAALIKRLREELAEAQRKIGQQQILIDYKNKLIDIAEEHYKIDIKKNSSSESSAGSGKKEKG